VSQDSPPRREDTGEELERIRRWVGIWKKAGPELEAIRRRDIAETDTPRALALLEEAFNQAVQSQPPRPTSGMVEMQKWLAKLPR
jgi:hypothetical protein